MLYSIVYRVLSWSARGAHLRPMHFPKPAPSRIVRNGAVRTRRNMAIVHKQLAGFSDFMEGLIIRERIK